MLNKLEEDTEKETGAHVTYSRKCHVNVHKEGRRYLRLI